MLHVFAGFSWLKHPLTTIDVWSDSFPPWDAQPSSQWQDSKYASGSGGVNARNKKHKVPEKERSMSRRNILRYSWTQIKRLVWALSWKAIGSIHQMFTLLCWLQIFVERKKMEVELQKMKVNFSWKPLVVSHPIPSELNIWWRLQGGLMLVHFLPSFFNLEPVQVWVYWGDGGPGSFRVWKGRKGIAIWWKESITSYYMSIDWFYGFIRKHFFMQSSFLNAVSICIIQVRNC